MRDFPKTYYPFLDALRGISIVWVLFHHGHWFFFMDQRNWGWFDTSIQVLGTAGFLGVDLFFVTSGFLITGLLKDEFLSGNVRVGRFYARRFFKIVPHYALVVAVTIGIYVWQQTSPAVTPAQIGAYAVMVQNYLPEHINPLSHTWSIAIEEHYYFVYPLLLLAIAGAVPTPSGRLRAVLIACAVLIFLGNLSRLYFFHGLSEAKAQVYQVTHVRFDALLFGCLIKFCEPWIIRHRREWAGAVFFVLAGFLLIFLITQIDQLSWLYSTLAYVAFGLLIVSALNGFSPLMAAGENRFLVGVGKASYGIYLWHYPVIIFYTALLKSTTPQESLVHLLLYGVLSVALGMFATNTWERFFLNVRNRWFP